MFPRSIFDVKTYLALLAWIRSVSSWPTWRTGGRQDAQGVQAAFCTL